MNPNSKPQSRQRGFTLVEIMVVVVIIGLLATVVMQNVFKDKDYAFLQKVKTDIVSIKSAVDRYQLYERKLPETLEDLTTENEDGHKYLDSLPSDPWYNPYEYEPEGGHKYSIRSNGVNGDPDDEDDITLKNMAELRTLPRIDNG